MTFLTNETNDILVLKIPGNVLDANNSMEFKKNIQPFLDNNYKFVFDMGELQFVDSSGCGAILSCLRNVKTSDGDIKLANVTKAVMNLFHLIRMHKIFDIYVSVDEAVEAYS